MNKSLVSMIIPAYNSEKYIERAMNSILNQTYQNIELIVINDGSRDRTSEIIEEIQQTDERIRYYEIENSGVSAARNLGLEHATGDYVGFVDADDYIELQMIELLMNKADEHSCDLVSCIFERIYPDRTVPERPRIQAGYYNQADLQETIYPHLFGNKYLETLLPLNIVTKLFKREIIEEHDIRFETNVKYGEDLLFTQTFLLNADDFYFFADKKCYKYTYNEASATVQHDENKWDNLKIALCKRKALVEEYPRYGLDDQIPYAVVISARNAIANASRNPSANKKERLEELTHIILDEDLQKALSMGDFSQLNFKNKIKVALMKRRKIKWMYLIQKYFSG